MYYFEFYVWLHVSCFGLLVENTASCRSAFDWYHRKCCPLPQVLDVLTGSQVETHLGYSRTPNAPSSKVTSWSQMWFPCYFQFNGEKPAIKKSITFDFSKLAEKVVSWSVVFQSLKLLVIIPMCPDFWRQLLVIIPMCPDFWRQQFGRMRKKCNTHVSNF
jgi:hypothetical protein